MFEYSNEKAIEYIFGFSHSGKPVKDLSRIKMLMSAIGDPQDRLKFVHIAGTNGKGSTARMFDGAFVRAGISTAKPLQDLQAKSMKQYQNFPKIQASLSLR